MLTRLTPFEALDARAAIEQVCARTFKGPLSERDRDALSRMAPAVELKPITAKLIGLILDGRARLPLPAKMADHLRQVALPALPEVSSEDRQAWEAARNDDRAESLARFARWIVSLDDPDGPGFEARRTVTMAQIIGKAREALALPEEF